jgi:hypothetical protein
MESLEINLIIRNFLMNIIGESAGNLSIFALQLQ